MPIPRKSTPIKHEILTEIFAKGVLNYDEMRIALFVIRWSWGFHENQTRKKFIISEIAQQIKMNRSTCSSIINKMLKENKLLREENKYQFNEHYQEWKVLEKTTVKKEESVGKNNSSVGKNNSSVGKNNSSVGKNNSQSQTNSIENKPAESLKVFKDNIKVFKDSNIHLQAQEIFKFWNEQKIEVHRVFEKFKSCISGALKNYTIEELKQAILNYATVLHGEQYRWTYKWTLDKFLTQKNALDRFIPENFKLEDYQKGGKYGKNQRYIGITAEISDDERERLKNITNAKAGEW